MSHIRVQGKVSETESIRCKGPTEQLCSEWMASPAGPTPLVCWKSRRWLEGRGESKVGRNEAGGGSWGSAGPGPHFGWETTEVWETGSEDVRSRSYQDRFSYRVENGLQGTRVNLKGNLLPWVPDRGLEEAGDPGNPLSHSPDVNKKKKCGCKRARGLPYDLGVLTHFGKSEPGEKWRKQKPGTKKWEKEGRHRSWIPAPSYSTTLQGRYHLSPVGKLRPRGLSCLTLVTKPPSNRLKWKFSTELGLSSDFWIWSLSSFMNFKHEDLWKHQPSAVSSISIQRCPRGCPGSSVKLTVLRPCQEQAH